MFVKPKKTRCQSAMPVPTFVTTHPNVGSIRWPFGLLEQELEGKADIGATDTVFMLVGVAQRIFEALEVGDSVPS